MRIGLDPASPIRTQYQLSAEPLPPDLAAMRSKQVRIQGAPVGEARQWFGHARQSTVALASSATLTLSIWIEVMG